MSQRVRGFVHVALSRRGLFGERAPMHAERLPLLIEVTPTSSLCSTLGVLPGTTRTHLTNTCASYLLVVSRYALRLFQWTTKEPLDRRARAAPLRTRVHELVREGLIDAAHALRLCELV